jgi:hypothetical protein
MNRVAWRRVLPICQVALFAAAMAQGERVLENIVFFLNFPAIVMTLPLSFLLLAWECPDHLAFAISLAVFWYVAGQVVDIYLKNRSAERIRPCLVRPLYAWAGLVYSGLVGGSLWLKAIESHDVWHRSTWFNWLGSLWPLAIAIYCSWKLVQWKNAHRPPLSSITPKR